METTLVLLKPDTLQRGLAGRILARFEARGLRLAALRMLRMTPELAAGLYQEHVGKPFYPPLVAYMTSSPILALALQGPGVIGVVRAMMGPTDGSQAPSGTIRGDFGLSKARNLVHGSDGPESAARELALFFPEGFLAWEPVLETWIQARD